MRVRRLNYCRDCGNIMSRNHRDVCPAYKEARERIGFRPFQVKQATPVKQRFGEGNFQMSARRG